MTLNRQPIFPNARSYVLKVHRDSLPGSGAVSGRLENMLSGQCFDFNNADELLASLIADLTFTTTESKE